MGRTCLVPSGRKERLGASAPRIKRPDMPTIWAKTNRVDHADYARLLHRPLKSQVSLEWQAPAQDFRLFYLLRRTGRRVKPCPVMAL